MTSQHKTFRQFLRDSVFKIERCPITKTVTIRRLWGSYRTVRASNTFRDYDPICREITKRDYHNRHGFGIGEYHGRE